MKGKGSTHPDKLQKISETSNIYTATQAPTANPQGRISLSSATAQRPPRRSSQHVPKEEEGTLQEKQQKIKNLQETIMDKKQKNDAIQQAFRKRKETGSFFDKDEFPELKVKILAQGCVKIASHHIGFKKALLKSLVLASKASKDNKAKGAKILLLWVIGWLSRMFGLLGHSLH